MTRAQKYLQWCAENGVDPIAFARYRLDQAKHAGRKHSVPLRTLASKKQLARWREWAGDASHAEWHTQKLTSEMLTPTEDRVRALMLPPTRAQELLRKDYANREQPFLCSVETRYTGGYDPRSAVCPSCPIKHQCLLSLNKAHGFDVGALRVGVFNRLPADVVEIARKARTKK